MSMSRKRLIVRVGGAGEEKQTVSLYQRLAWHRGFKTFSLHADRFFLFFKDALKTARTQQF